MNLTHRILTLLAICMLPFSLAATLPIAPGAELRCVSSNFAFTEGPAADTAGNVYFTDQPNDRIHLWNASTGEVSVFMEPSGRSNGLWFTAHPQPTLYACADADGELWSIDVDTLAVTVRVAGFSGKLLNGPNDVWVHPDGSLYFTDPFYKRPYWNNREAPEQPGQHVYRLPVGSTEAIPVETGLQQPNGIIGTPDGRQLFVADIGAKQTWVYTIDEQGELSDKRLFCELGSDGMTLDADGNLYLTGDGVTVFSPKGKLLGNIPVPENWTANVTFAGPEHRTLFITAMGSIYTLEMSVSGAAFQH